MILMYHHVAASASEQTLSLDRFCEQMDYLQSTKFQIVSLTEYIRYCARPSAPPRIAISFDDGYKSFTTQVLPVLINKSIPVSLFVPVGYVGGFNFWDTVRGAAKIEILNWEDLRHIARSSLVTIGVHSYSHIPLRGLTEDQAYQEIVLAKQQLEKELNIVVDYFAFPYGQVNDFDDYAIFILQQAGYKAALSTLWRRKNRIANVYQLGRVEIAPNLDLANFKRILHRRMDPKYWKQRLKTKLYRWKIRK